MKRFIWLLPLALFVCTSCNYSNKGNKTASKNDTSVSLSQRKPYEGFEWKEISGAGMKLMAQRSENIRLLVDPLLHGIVMVRNGDDAPHALIRIFQLKNKRIDDVIDILSNSADWDKNQTCRFEEVSSGRSGVRRYIMLPDGDYAEMIDSMKKQEPVPSTCNGWGTGNSGMRYFEIYDDAPDKAVFVEIGQDAPLFDENSIELCYDLTRGK